MHFSKRNFNAKKLGGASNSDAAKLASKLAAGKLGNSLSTCSKNIKNNLSKNVENNLKNNPVEEGEEGDNVSPVVSEPLTIDHKPETEKEEERIVKNGGKVITLGACKRVASADLSFSSITFFN